MTINNSVFRFLRKPITVAFIVTIIIGILYSYSTFLSSIDLIGRDSFFRIRHSIEKVPSETQEIVLIAIDDLSTKKVKQKWPFPRAVFGEAIRRINEFKPKVIGFDFVFQGQDQLPESDENLRQAMLGAGNVVIASYMDNDGKVISADAPLRSAAYQSSLVNKIKDRDSIVRRAPLYFQVPGEDKIQWSWESDIFFKAIGFDQPQLFPEANYTLIKSGHRQLRVPSFNGAMDINYRADDRDFTVIPFWKLMDGEVNSEQIQGKIVLIGLTALAFHDFHETPLGTISGLSLNANAILTLLRNDFLQRVPVYFSWILIFLSVWLTLSVTERYSILKSFATIVVSCLIFLFASFSLLLSGVIWDLAFLVAVTFFVFFFAVIYKQFQTAIENIRLREESVRDPLTGFYTRRFLEVHLNMDIKKVLSSGRKNFGEINEVAVVMIDLDNFKLVNDSFGHQEGDRVLRTLGQSIRSSVRKDEIVCRFGGDEFCVILPGTSLENAVKFAEKLRLLIVNNPDLNYTTQAGVKSFRVTGSFGVASVKGMKAMSAENLMKAADRALYRAKTGGRNQVCTYDPERDVLDGK